MPGVSSHTDLEIYKLAVELRREVVTLTARGPARRDFEFSRQIRNSVRGPARNIAEGFARLAPAEFRRFLGYARASLEETKNHIEDGYDSGYFDAEQHRRLMSLVRRTLAGVSALMRYLSSPAALHAYRGIVRKRDADQPRPERTLGPNSPRSRTPRHDD